MVDLRSLEPALDRERRTRKRVGYGLAALFALLAAGSLFLRAPGAPGLTGLQLFLVEFFILGCAIFLALTYVGQFTFPNPTDLAVDSGGLRLSWGPVKTRTYPWSESASWLELWDWREQIRRDPTFRYVGPFAMTRVTRQMVFLTEEAGLAVLDGAKAAGVPLRTRVATTARQKLKSSVYVAEQSSRH